MLYPAVAMLALACSPPLDLHREIETLRTEIELYKAEHVDLGTTAERAQMLHALVTDVLHDAHDHISLRDAAGTPWNQLRSADGAFVLNLNLYMQTDWLLNATEGQNATWSFASQRARLTFSGSVFDESFRYFLRIQNTATGWGTEGAFIQKNLDDAWFVQAGQIFPMFSIEEAVSNDEELGVGLSFLSGQFDEELSDGVQLGWQGDSVRFWACFSNGFAQMNVTPIFNRRQGVMSRVEFKPFGSWSDLYSYNPHPNRVESGVLIGLAAAYDWGTYNDPITPTFLGGHAFRATADISYQTPGFGTVFSAYYQDVDSTAPFGGDRWAFVGQVTGFVSPKVQLYGRFEWGTIATMENNDITVATIGSSVYPFESKNVKLSFELMYLFDGTTNWNLDGDPGVFATSEPQAVIRSQLQISF